MIRIKRHAECRESFFTYFLTGGGGVRVKKAFLQRSVIVQRTRGQGDLG